MPNRKIRYSVGEQDQSYELTARNVKITRFRYFVCTLFGNLLETIKDLLFSMLCVCDLG